MTWLRKILLTVVGIGLLLGGAVYWAVGTSAGTRWILARAAAQLPESLVLGEPRGSLLYGIRFESLEWQDESIHASIRDLFFDIEFFPLFSRHVAIKALDIAQVDIQTYDSAETSDTDGLPSVNLPLDISIAAASVRNASYRRAQAERQFDAIEFSGQLQASILDITSLRLRSKWLNADLDARVKLSGKYPARATLKWQWTESNASQYAGGLQIEGNVRSYKLRHVLSAPVAVTTTGEVSYESGELLADLNNAWTALQWPVGDRQLRSPTGTLRLRGNASRFDVALNADAMLDDLPETSIQLVGSADTTGMQISSVDAVNEFGRLAASGNLVWLPEFDLDLEYVFSELDASLVSAAISGAMEVNGRVQARLHDQAPAIDLQVARFGGDINEFPVTGRADIAYAGDTLTVTDGRIQLGSNIATVSGSVGDTVVIDARVNVPALAEIVPDASGSLHGRFGLSGATDNPGVTLDMRSDGLAWGNYVLDSAQAYAAGKLGQHAIRFSIRRANTELTAEATAGYAQDHWSGVVKSLAIDNDVMGRWAARESSELLVSGEQISLSPTCVFASSASGSACIGGNLPADGAATFELSVADLPLAAIPVALPPDVNVSGFLNARLQGQLEDQRLTGVASVALEQPVIDTTYEGETIAVIFSEATGSATVADNRVESSLRLGLANDAGAADLQLAIQDIADPQAPVTGRANVAVSDVSLFAVLVPGVVNPRGRIDGGLTISGSVAQPGLAGEIALTAGSFRVRQAGIELTDVDARLSQRADGRLQLMGSARSGDGQVAIQGESQINAESGMRTEVFISGDNFELLRLPDWQAAASPAINIVLDERKARVTGELAIPSAAIKVKDIPETAASPSPDAIVHRPEGSEVPTGRRVDIDVKTALGSDVQFSGFGLTTGLGGTVQLRGGTHAPYTGIGRLSLQQGRYKAYGQTLEIERGELIFNGPLNNPQLDIRAIRRATDVVAGIQLSGTVSNLRSEVFSEPPLNDAEALSYLLTGRPLAGATSAGEGDTLNKAAFALGLSGAGSIASRVRGELGLETLTVEGGADNGRILAGKRFGDRLLVEYGYGLIDKLGTLLLRYQLSKRILLESRTGTVSNLDVVYSVKKK